MTTRPDEDGKRPGHAAQVAAALYASFLNIPIPVPPGGRDIRHFTPEQAFELTRTLFYESLRDEET